MLAEEVKKDKAGNTYEAILNIADGRERRILYNISYIRKIDTNKEAADGDVPSTKNGRGSHINSYFPNKLTENGSNVKGKFSISEEKQELPGPLPPVLPGGEERNDGEKRKPLKNKENPAIHWDCWIS